MVNFGVRYLSVVYIILFYSILFACNSNNPRAGTPCASAGKNGVYIILGGFSPPTTGHATLWIGIKNDVIGGHNYIDYGGTVYFWELK